VITQTPPVQHTEYHSTAADLRPAIIADELPALEIVGALKSFRKENGPQEPFWKRGAREPRELTIAVDQISITVPRGEIFGLLGANGSGKSTLIRLVSTLLILDGGEIRVFGNDVHKDERVVRRLINRVSVEASFLKEREYVAKHRLH
jgi:ABC-2 type transport system ATP-binding protein